MNCNHGSMSFHIVVCISLANLEAPVAEAHFVLTCFNRGTTAEAVNSFSPDKASVKYERGSTIISRTENSASDGILCQFFQSSAKTALSACCCSTIRGTPFHMWTPTLWPPRPSICAMEDLVAAVSVSNHDPFSN